jgi:hypothetical protein
LIPTAIEEEGIVISFMINSGTSKTYTCLWESQIATQSTNTGSSDDDDDAIV